MSGQRVAPFNPGTQRWEEHVQWSVHRSFAIVGISTHGRTTVARLQMSHPKLVSIRCLLAALGISWKVEAYRDRGSLGHHFGISAVRTGVSHVTIRDARAIGVLCEDERGQTKGMVRWTCRQRF